MILQFVNYLLPVSTYIKSRNESRSKITPPVNLTGAVEKGLIKKMIHRIHNFLLNDREFWLILLIRDWPRRGLLDRTSEWVHRKCLMTVYSGSLWCHNENAGFRVKFLLRLASLMCIFSWRHNIRTSFRADFCLRLTTPWTFLSD